MQTKKPFSWKKWLCLTALTTWLGTVLLVDPLASGPKAWAVFYGSLGMALFFSVLWLSEAVLGQEANTLVRRYTVRWAALLTILFLGLLLLQQFRLLLWWIGLLWLAFVLLAELVLSRGGTEG